MSLSLGLTSCSKDEDPEVDVREQAIGSYEGTVELLALSDFDLKYHEEAISFTVSKNNTSVIDISIDGDIIQGVKVKKASNGFTFDIESQSVNMDDDAEKETIVGENFFELGGVKYNGMYDSGKKEFLFAMSTTMEVDTDDDGISDTEIDVLIGVSGTKK